VDCREAEEAVVVAAAARWHAVPERARVLLSPTVPLYVCTMHRVGRACLTLVRPMDSDAALLDATAAPHALITAALTLLHVRVSAPRLPCVAPLHPRPG
jgi:hypothetical protein